jgi:hypothetical protein
MDADFWEEHKPRFLKQDAPKTPPTVVETPSMKPYIEGDPHPTVPAELKAHQQWGVRKEVILDDTHKCASTSTEKR